MTIEELYEKVKADDALKAELDEAVKADRATEWAVEQGVDATEDELIAYVRALAAKGQELTEDELAEVAGGSSLWGSIKMWLW